MGNAGGVQPRGLFPDGGERLIAYVIRAGSLERLDIRLPRDDERVSVGTECSRHHLGHPHTRLGGHECRERLVLDLLQSSIRHAPRRIPIGHRAPAAGESLRVLCVMAEHSDFQLITAGVLPHILHGTAVLPLRGPELGNVDAERGQGTADVLRKRKALGRSEHQAHDCAGPDPERKRTEYR